MAGSVNKVIPSELYLQGLSIPQVSKQTGIAQSTLRFRFKREGILRDRATAVRMAAKEGRLGDGLRGKSRIFTKQHCDAISKGRRKWSEENALGTRISSNGYVEYTKGPSKGRSVHVVKMEARIGRALSEDECVHHIDGDKQNNEDNNLALVTRSGHTRLHRREDAISGKIRERLSNGRLS